MTETTPHPPQHRPQPPSHSKLAPHKPSTPHAPAHKKASTHHEPHASTTHKKSNAPDDGHAKPKAKRVTRTTHRATHGAATHSPKQTTHKTVNKHGVRKFRIGLAVAFLVLLLVGGALAWREISKTSQQGQTRQTAAKEGPIVQTAKASKAPTEQTLTLEGEARPFLEATMYAKVSGYLKTIKVIEGSIVKKGDVLAIVSSPETDQSYMSALADARNKDRVAARYKELLKQDLVSAQEAEQIFATAQVADASLRSASQGKDYETIRAPFDGTVTARYVDPGDLIQNASNSKSTQLAILTLSDTHRLKVDAYVDQKYAPNVHAGLAVETFLPDRTDERYKGEVARVSGALDHKTRMLFTEIDFDNSAGQVISGSFVQVQLKVPTPAFFTLPIEALVTLNGAAAVAKILPNHHLQFAPIDIVDNDGTTITVSNGIKEGEEVALNVGAELKNGDVVRVPQAQKPPDGHQPPKEAANESAKESEGSAK